MLEILENNPKLTQAPSQQCGEKAYYVGAIYKHILIVQAVWNKLRWHINTELEFLVSSPITLFTLLGSLHKIMLIIVCMVIQARPP